MNFELPHVMSIEDAARMLYEQYLKEYVEDPTVDWGNGPGKHMSFETFLAGYRNAQVLGSLGVAALMEG